MRCIAPLGVCCRADKEEIAIDVQPAYNVGGILDQGTFLIGGCHQGSGHLVEHGIDAADLVFLCEPGMQRLLSRKASAIFSQNLYAPGNSTNEKPGQNKSSTD